MLDNVPWTETTDSQKLEFLREWLIHFDQAVQNIQLGVQRLLEIGEKAANCQPPTQAALEAEQRQVDFVL
jgi:hypothetical protein